MDDEASKAAKAVASRQTLTPDSLFRTLKAPKFKAPLSSMATLGKNKLLLRSTLLTIGRVSKLSLKFLINNKSQLSSNDRVSMKHKCKKNTQQSKWVIIINREGPKKSQCYTRDMIKFLNLVSAKRTVLCFRPHKLTKMLVDH